MGLHYGYRLGHTTITEIVREVCILLWQKLYASKAMPTTEEWLKIANTSEKNANFPHCIGAIDGKHVRVIKPAHSGSLYYNYKNYFSIVLLAVCDANYNFTFVDVGAYGKSNDSAIFKDSLFYRKLMNNSLKIPKASPLTEKHSAVFPYVLVGDEAFGMSENLMRPYGGNNLSYEQKIFNYRLSRARRYVECAFGILSNKWRIFHRPLNVGIDFAQDIVKACCALHNFVRARDGFVYEDSLEVIGFECAGHSGRSGRSALAVRDKFSEYFANHNPIKWQSTYVQ